MYTGQEANVNEVNAKSKSLQLQLLYFTVSHITGPVGSRHPEIYGILTGRYKHRAELNI